MEETRNSEVSEGTNRLFAYDGLAECLIEALVKPAVVKVADRAVDLCGGGQLTNKCNDGTTLMKAKSINEVVKAAPMPAFCSVSEEGRVTHDARLFFEFLETNGFRTVNSGSNLEFVRIEGNVISIVDDVRIRHFVLDHIRQNMPIEVVEYYLSHPGHFSVNYLSSLTTVTPEILRDTQTSAYFFFLNGVVEVTHHVIKEPVPYDKYGKLVWSNQIIPRDFKLIGEVSVFEKFCRLISDGKEDRFNHLCCILGYMMHNYRTSANTRAIILNDENVSDQPEGGSGKGLLLKGVGQIRNVVEQDGKKFAHSKEFAYSSVNESVDVLLLDDIAKGFDFENLFSAITNGFNVNRKNKDEYRLPVEKSPLVVITTNRVLKGNSGSFRRRQYSIDIGRYFSANHTPIDEFGHTFFNDWDSDEWARFDSFMLSGVRLYLEDGIVEAQESDHEMKELIRSTCDSFAAWIEDTIDDIIDEGFISTAQAKGRYLKESGINAAISDQRFLGWVKEYCELKKLDFIADRTSSMRGFRIFPHLEE